MKQRIFFGVSIACMIAPWLWPFLLGPLPAMLPDLVAWSTAAVLISLLPLLRERLTEAIAWGWLIAAIANAIIALLQYFDLENSLQPWVIYAEPGIAFGNIQQANLFASLLSVGLLALIFLIKTERLKPWVAFLFCLFLILGHSVAASRTGLIQLAAIVFLLLYWRPWAFKKMLPWLVFGGFILLLTGWAFPYILKTVLNVDSVRQLLQRVSTGYGCQSRIVIWSNVLELIQMRPWTGWGWDGLLYAHYMQPMQGERACIKLSNAHNIFLQLAVEYGIPIATGVFLLMLAIFWRLKPWQEQQNGKRLGWSVLIMLAVHSMVEFPLWFGYFQLMVGLALVLIFNTEFKATQDHEQPSVFRLRALCTSLSLALLTFVAYDYHRVSQLYLPQQWRSHWYEQDTLAVAQKSSLFKSHALIGQVLLIPITPDNAALMLEAAEQSLRIAPDSRIIRRLLEAAEILGREDLILLHSKRYQAAWPEEYREWKLLNDQRKNKK
jgi:O-antigen polymerase